MSSTMAKTLLGVILERSEESSPLLYKEPRDPSSPLAPQE